MFVGLMATLALFASCSDKGNQPEPEKWNVYAACASTGNIYILDADSLTVRDSIPDMREVNSIAVSPDGRWLYAQSHRRLRQSLLTKIDVRTKAKAGILPSQYYSSLTLLNRGGLLLCGMEYCQNEVVNTVDLGVSRILSDTLCRRRGGVSGTKVAAVVTHSNSPDSVLPWQYTDSIIRVTDIESGEAYGEYVPHLLSGHKLYFASDAIVHPDGRRVLVIAHTGPAWFVIGDVLTGETLFEYPLATHFGEIALSDDGAYAAVSDPGQFMIGETPPSLDIFDLSQMRHLKRFNMFAAQIRFFAGGGKLLSGPRSRTDTGGALRVIDLNLLVVERDVVPLPGSLMGAIGVGRHP